MILLTLTQEGEVGPSRGFVVPGGIKPDHAEIPAALGALGGPLENSGGTGMSSEMRRQQYSS